MWRCRGRSESHFRLTSVHIMQVSWTLSLWRLSYDIVVAGNNLLGFFFFFSPLWDVSYSLCMCSLPSLWNMKKHGPHLNPKDTMPGHKITLEHVSDYRLEWAPDPLCLFVTAFCLLCWGMGFYHLIALLITLRLGTYMKLPLYHLLVRRIWGFASGSGKLLLESGNNLFFGRKIDWYLVF